VHDTRGETADVTGRGVHRRRRQTVVAVGLALVMAVVTTSVVVTYASAADGSTAAVARKPPTELPITAQVVEDGAVPYRFGPQPSGGTLVENQGDTGLGGLEARWIWSPPGTATGASQSACDTWDSQSGPITQEGVALRVISHDGIEQRAITVTKNVFANTVWVFNVHLWNGSTYKLIGQYTLSRDFLQGHRLAPLPWRMCAAITGTTLRFKVWPLTDPEPAYGNPVFGATLTVPATWVYPQGRPGLYVGHLGPGDQASFSDEDLTAR